MENVRQKVKNGIVIGGIVLFFVLKSSSKQQEETPPKPAYTNMDALVSSREFVRRQLKAPSQADFSNDVSRVIKQNDSTYNVSSYVDAPNIYGVKLHVSYSCVITFMPGDSFKCNNLEINDPALQY